MVLSILFLIITIFGGALWTYLYEEKSSFITRLLEGAFVGQVIWGLSCFIIASFSGLNLTSILISTYITVLIPLAYILWKQRNKFNSVPKTYIISLDQILKKIIFHRTTIIIYSLVFIIFWLSLSKGAYTKDAGIYTKYIDNYSDFTLHAGIINGFVFGDNYPPQHPDYAGSRLTYPFLTDFITAMLVVLGAPLLEAMFLQNIMYLLLFVGLLHLFVRQFSKSAFVLIAVLALIFFNGGLGWTFFIKEFFASNTDFINYIFHLPHDYSSYGDKIRWGTSIGFWFVPMRSMLLGMPIFIVIVNLWWRSFQQFKATKSNVVLKRMAGAGVIAGLLPLVHGHSLLTIFIVAIGTTLLFRSLKLWFVFFAALILVSLPQLTWMASDTHASLKYFFGFIPGWNLAEKNILLFWFVNTGLFIPLLIIALRKRNLLDPDLRLFYAPFLLCFIVPNFIKLAPWEWDNVKVLAYWYIFSTLPVALFLGNLWNKGVGYKVITLLLFLSLTLSGILDNWRAWANDNDILIYDSSELKIADYIKKELPSGSVILNAPLHGSPVFMSGKLSYVGSLARIWSHGILWTIRENEAISIYTGGRDAKKLLTKNNIDYVIVSDLERYWAGDTKIELNEDFFQRYPVQAEVAHAKIYRITQ